MQVIVTKLTQPDLMRKACSYTTGKPSSASLDRMYDCEHSPIRTQMFWVEMIGIPTFVSVHFVRHKVGVEHYVRSNRDDRGGDEKVDRDTPVNHAMLCNAQALIHMSRKRLCGRAHQTTREVMKLVRLGVAYEDGGLAAFMVPECDYRGGICHELVSCGRCPK